MDDYNTYTRKKLVETANDLHGKVYHERQVNDILKERQEKEILKLKSEAYDVIKILIKNNGRNNS